jgi:hypothetical protein
MTSRVRGVNGARNKNVSSSGNVRQVVKSILNARVEHKRAAVIFSVNSAAAGAITPITQGFVQGDDLGQRTGNVSILERIDYVITSINILAPSRLRVILFVDHLNNGSIPAITDVLTAATPNDAFNPLTVQSNRFKILQDYYLLTVGPPTTSSKHVNAKHYHLRPNQKVHYNAATNVAGANGKGAVFMIFLDTGANCTYSVGMNLTFSDA